MQAIITIIQKIITTINEVVETVVEFYNHAFINIHNMDDDDCTSDHFD